MAVPVYPVAHMAGVSADPECWPLTGDDIDNTYCEYCGASCYDSRWAAGIKPYERFYRLMVLIPGATVFICQGCLWRDQELINEIMVRVFALLSGRTNQPLEHSLLLARQQAAVAMTLNKQISLRAKSRAIHMIGYHESIRTGLQQLLVPRPRILPARIAGHGTDKDGNTFIYFMRSLKSGLIKIGRSVNPRHRKSTLEHELDDQLEIIHTIKGPPRLEIELHKRFRLFRSLHPALKHKREWFEPSAELIQFIDEQLQKLKDEGRAA